ncbi:beta-amyrin 24-hydroxylase-like [Cicer arietinum]|uniref:Beta-amyrin 24-hydroxylase CYP93E5 n=1 Tax=Cicer arietinum TaxID=3827 RepID=A0A088LUP1_CICAR|nr:beta-amyrin 24-hydroxylase-like [Cicer arietinum]AIN25417.1 beta-amyrin 24-hydroxylase CYP93E5 [Cicer arietinum]
MLEIQGYLVLFLLWFISTIFIKSIIFKKSVCYKLPPGPPISVPFLGHAPYLRSLLHQALYKLSIRYGPLMHIMLGSKHVIVASSAESAKNILKTYEESFCNRPIMIASESLTYGAADYFFIPYGNYWRFLKKLCMTELLSGKTLEHFVSIREDEIKAFLNTLLEISKSGKKIEMRQELIRHTNNIISRMTMGKKSNGMGDEVGKLRKLVREIGELLGAFNLGDIIEFMRPLDLQGFGKRNRNAHHNMDEMMEKVLKEHEEVRAKEGVDSDRKKDLFDILLNLIEADSKLTRESAKAFALDMFIAGTNGPASVLEWALAELIRNPQVFKKAREEIDSVVGKERLVKESDIPNLPYLQAVVKETLRLHPPTPIFAREAIRSCQVDGYDIPEHSKIFINAWAIGRDPNYWDNPLVYDPERFLLSDDPSKSKIDVRGQYYQLLPFGSGRRSCPGASLALLVIQATLASLVQCYDWVVNDGKSNEIDMSEVGRVTVFLAKPLKCKPVPHFVPFSA